MKIIAFCNRGFASVADTLCDSSFAFAKQPYLEAIHGRLQVPFLGKGI